MGDIIKGNGFFIDETKFNFFFGKVISHPINKMR